jgi:hypothetical protein
VHTDRTVPVTEVALSAVYAFYNGMPIVPFALPRLLWWALVRPQ